MSLLDPAVRQLMGAHATIYRATNGLVGHHIPGLPPILVLDHVGAKTGVERRSALVYLMDGEDVVIVASKGGSPRNPAWFHNLRAHPETTVQIGSERRRVRARVATSEERERIWPRVVSAFGTYQSYQERTEREIPLIILEPRTG